MPTNIRPAERSQPSFAKYIDKSYYIAGPVYEQNPHFAVKFRGKKKTQT